ncbi:hypothetical protein [Streptomyces cyaneofuscatus]|uniref:hypothetical protein n=1 Tax=Streptomyces cyaneofuscatus TaxID=66883 RepID=UPI0013DBFDED|nr:hypothetical protein [Streptomyces cyaneofuscatus]NDZ63573.1 hypothetical protein [Streptomyces cyaneofuscatus]
MPKAIKHTAADKTMTLSELAAFVQDALRSDADGTERVKANITFGGRLKDVTVDLTTPQRAQGDAESAALEG